MQEASLPPSREARKSAAACAGSCLLPPNGGLANAGHHSACNGKDTCRVAYGIRQVRDTDHGRTDGRQDEAQRSHSPEERRRGRYESFYDLHNISFKR